MSGWGKPVAMLWEEPLALTSRFVTQDIALLYSGLKETYSGSESYLFIEPLETRSGSTWDELPELRKGDDALPLWVGYLGYGMREEKARGASSPITLPDFRLVRYATLYRFDHVNQQMVRYGKEQIADAAPAATLPPPIRTIASNISRDEYLSIVRATIEQIRSGNFYQANITRKFYGEFASKPNSWSIFEQLCKASPAPYSAYIRHEGSAILSSSPECFLSIANDGTVTTRPIKGSARRSEDAIEDQKVREALIASTKNHAENLMIVDLMRNDLSRVSEPMSVKVVEQSALYSYRTIHHLISTIRAKLRIGISTYDAVRACFPAGSMTGAPKIAAIDWCTKQEKLERGVYSGAIGWFGANNTCDLSVIIRTLLIDGKRFEFQVGGGIVADSTPEDEWRETITKARGILAALGLSEEVIAKL